MLGFTVIDTTTNQYPDLWKIATTEEWAKHLMDCDMEGFAISEDGGLLLLDECGGVAYCPADRFKVVYTADVAPRAEVDKTIAEWAYLHADTVNKLDNVRAEVAREIFEEIERLITKECLVFKDENGIRGYVDASVHYAIAELKKKYTQN